MFNIQSFFTFFFFFIGCPLILFGCTEPTPSVLTVIDQDAELDRIQTLVGNSSDAGSDIDYELLDSFQDEALPLHDQEMMDQSSLETQFDQEILNQDSEISLDLDAEVIDQTLLELDHNISPYPLDFEGMGGTMILPLPDNGIISSMDQGIIPPSRCSRARPCPRGQRCVDNPAQECIYGEERCEGICVDTLPTGICATFARCAGRTVEICENSSFRVAELCQETEQCIQGECQPLPDVYGAFCRTNDERTACEDARLVCGGIAIIPQCLHPNVFDGLGQEGEACYQSGDCLRSFLCTRSGVCSTGELNQACYVDTDCIDTLECEDQTCQVDEDD